MVGLSLNSFGQKWDSFKVISRYDNGAKKVIAYYEGEAYNEDIVMTVVYEKECSDFIKEETYYDNGGRISRHIVNTSCDQIPKMELNFKYGKKDGSQKYYFPHTHNLKKIEEYKDGAFISKECWDKDGNIITCP
jgi:antitoxin component YwqK of YwqJK toxin-antitoxin module